LQHVADARLAAAAEATSSWSISGTIVREIMFQFSSIDTGITGCTFSSVRLPSSGPMSKS
jgi:hypothetical protein